jgi:hypothetical protein
MPNFFQNFSLFIGLHGLLLLKDLIEFFMFCFSFQTNNMSIDNVFVLFFALFLFVNILGRDNFVNDGNSPISSNMCSTHVHVTCTLEKNSIIQCLK